MLLHHEIPWQQSNTAMERGGINKPYTLSPNRLRISGLRAGDEQQHLLSRVEV